MIVSINGVLTNNYLMWYRFQNSIFQKNFKLISGEIIPNKSKLVYVCPCCNQERETTIEYFNSKFYYSYKHFPFVCRECVRKNKHLTNEEKIEKNKIQKQKELITKTKNESTPKDILRKTGKLGFIGQDQFSGSIIRDKMNLTKSKNNSNTNKGTEAYFKRKETFRIFSDEKTNSIIEKQNKTKFENGTHPKQKFENGEVFGFVNLPKEEREKLSKLIDSILRVKDEKGLSTYKKISIKRIKTLTEKGAILKDSDLSDFELYRKKVWTITNNNDLSKLENFNKRGRADLNKDAFHLDHKFSIKQGFLNNILPYYIGHLNNLEMIFHLENCKKQDKCSIELESLF